MTAAARLIRVPFPAGLVILSRRRRISVHDVSGTAAVNASRRTADSGKLSHRITSPLAPANLPYTSKASLAGGFFGDVGLLRKIGNNEWNHHGQW